MIKHLWLLPSPRGAFQIVAQRGKQADHSGLTELKRQGFEFGDAEGNEICKAIYWGKENCAELELQKPTNLPKVLLNFWLNSELHVCSAEELHEALQRSCEMKIPRAHVGLWLISNHLLKDTSVVSISFPES